MYKKGNILFIVMFILLLSSLISLLIVNYVKQIFSSSSLFYDYYQSYYLANAGIELGLVKIKNRGYGFEDSVLSGSQVDNIRSCKQKPCYVRSSIQATHNILTDTVIKPTSCNTDQYYIKKNGQNLIVPLFTDTHTTTEKTIDGISIEPLNVSEISSIKIFASGSNLKYAVALLIADQYGEFIDSIVNIYDQNNILLSALLTTGTSYGGSILEKITQNTQGFLIISNLSPNDIGLCLQSTKELPTTSVVLTSQGYYHNSVVSLQAVKKVAIPDDYAYATIGGIGQ